MDNEYTIIPNDDCVNIVNGKVIIDKECSDLKDSYTVIYGSGDCQSIAHIIVKKEDKEPEPTGCAAFIVDGGSWGDVPQTGDSTCDSAFLYIDGRPIFTPSSAKTWVNIEFKHWDEDPHDYNNFCTVYTDAPCVANDLMRDAGIVDNDISCKDIPYPTMADMPQIVQDTITSSTKYSHALGTVRYNIAPNNEGADRTCTIRWIVDSVECPSKDFIITQLGGSTPPTPTCTCDDLIVIGKTISYEAKENIQIGSYSVNCITNISATSSSKDWVTSLSVNNGKIFAKVAENDNTEEPRTSTITVTGKTDTSDCSKTFVVTQSKKITSCTTCEDANIEGLSGGATAEGGTNILIGSFSYSCDPGLTAKRVSGEDFITNMTVSNGNVYGTVSPNTATTPRTEDIGIYVGDGTTPCAQYTLTQQGATCICKNANIQLGTTAITLGYNKDSTAETTYSHDCTVYINNNEAEGWLDVNSTNGKLEFNSTSQATSTRDANVYIDDANGNHCKTIKVTQEGCGAKLNISYGILFENQLVAVDSLSDNAVYSVGGAKVNYTKCDGSKGSFLISAAYGTTDTFVYFRKENFISGDEAIKTTSFTVSDLASIDSITLPEFISVGGGRNIWGTTEQPWGGDFRNESEKTPGATYAYECYASCISDDSYINARNTYTLDGNNLTIYLSFEEIFL